MDLFFISNKIDIANYADDITPYTSSNDVNRLIQSLEEASKQLRKWFDDNLMKSNPEKCHLLVSTNDNVAIRIGNYALGRVTPYENLSKIKILMNTFFNSHLIYSPLTWMCHSRIINKNKQIT